MSLNVLVVDDSAVMRSMIVKALKLTGVPLGEIHQAADGREGLEALDRAWVDLVLVDINMPVMNGQEMIEQLRARPDGADVAVIVVSTDGSEARVEMMQRHRARFVQKPFSPETLRDVILETTGVTHDGAGIQAPRCDGPDF
jgi:two-component system, chemotaxis family, chemotaxis protein CheY